MHTTTWHNICLSRGIGTCGKLHASEPLVKKFTSNAWSQLFTPAAEHSRAPAHVECCCNTGQVETSCLKKATGAAHPRCSHTPRHSAKVTKQWFERYESWSFQHSSHRPDLIPSSFHVFGSLQKVLRCGNDQLAPQSWCGFLQWRFLCTSFMQGRMLWWSVCKSSAQAFVYVLMQFIVLHVSLAVHWTHNIFVHTELWAEMLAGTMQLNGGISACSCLK
jgi:hypothetical protein